MNAKAQRFMKDLGDFHANAIDGIIIADYDEVGMSFVDVCTGGPEETPYAGVTFSFRLRIPPDFPFSRPKAEMHTPIWHPNISTSGRICVNVLSDWSPGTSLLEVAEAVRALLCFPNPDSPLNADAAWMMDTNLEMFQATAKMWAATFANGPDTPVEYQNKVQQIVEVLNFSEERALKSLSARQWSIDDVVRHSRR